jgi:release factor glutamine methyltransferase
MTARRVAGEPLEHVVGWVDFAGLRVGVAPGVFVPRQRTVLLVEAAMAGLQAGGDVLVGRRPGVTVVDLACGCGAIGLAVAARVPGVALYAADLDPVAVECAAANLAPVGGRVLRGDLFDALPPDLAGRIDVLLANVPYVPSGAVPLLPPEARLYEPRTALDGGGDGLDLARRVFAGAARWLAPGGRVLVETGEGQVPAALAAVAAAGLTGAVLADDERGATVVTGARPRQPARR